MINLTRVVGLSACLSTLFGCSQPHHNSDAARAPAPTAHRTQEEAALKIIRESLTDPDSARFTHVRIRTVHTQQGEILESLCGEVNAKNRYGGYVGATPFVYILRHTKVIDSQTAFRVGVFNIYDNHGPHDQYHIFCDEDGATRPPKNLNLAIPDL